MKNVLWITDSLKTKEIFESISEKQKNVDLIIVDETQIECFDKELILNIKTIFPNIPIIYICDVFNAEKKYFLFYWNIYNLLLSSQLDKINELINNPILLHDIGITIEENNS